MIRLSTHRATPELATAERPRPQSPTRFSTPRRVQARSTTAATTSSRTTRAASVLPTWLTVRRSVWQHRLLQTTRPAETLAITTSSSAYEEVPESSCTLPTDERGDPRPGCAEASCDADAFELQSGAPYGVAASPANASAVVAWTPPAPGPLTLSHYTVTASPGGETASASASATSATVNGLTNGTFYTFTVTSTGSPSCAPTPLSGPPYSCTIACLSNGKSYTF